MNAPLTSHSRRKIRRRSMNDGSKGNANKVTLDGKISRARDFEIRWSWYWREGKSEVPLYPLRGTRTRSRTSVAPMRVHGPRRDALYCENGTRDRARAALRAVSQSRGTISQGAVPSSQSIPGGARLWGRVHPGENQCEERSGGFPSTVTTVCSRHEKNKAAVKTTESDDGIAEPSDGFDIFKYLSGIGLTFLGIS